MSDAGDINIGKPPAPPAGPLTERGRVGVLDAVRGFALWGIAVVNVPWFGVTLLDWETGRMGWPDGPLDAAARAAVVALGHGKFFPLFALLFGYGFAVQRGRAARRGDSGIGPYGRRLAGLLVLGALHAVFLFFGDVLTLYAVLGAGLWLVRDWRPGWLAGLGGLFVGLAGLVGVLAGLSAVMFAQYEPGPTPPELEAARAAAAADYGAGSFLDAAARRTADLPAVLVLGWLSNGPLSAAMFCFGLAAGKLGVFSDPDTWLPRARRAVLLLLPAGLAGGGLLAAAEARADALPAALILFAHVFTAAAGPALSLCYAWGVWEWDRLGDRLGDRFGGVFDLSLAPLRAAGRMSLSVYLGESVLANVWFAGWGRGLFDSAGDAAEAGIATLNFAVLAGAAWLWLRVFAHGPAEWLLRCVTYGRAVPLRRRAG